MEVKTKLTTRFKGSCFVDRIQTQQNSLLQIGSHAGALAGFQTVVSIQDAKNSGSLIGDLALALDYRPDIGTFQNVVSCL